MFSSLLGPILLLLHIFIAEKKSGFFQRMGFFGKKADKVAIQDEQTGGKRKTRARHNKKKYVSKRKTRKSKK